MDEWNNAPWPVKLGALSLVTVVMVIVGSLAAVLLIWIWS